MGPVLTAAALALGATAGAAQAGQCVTLESPMKPACFRPSGAPLVDLAQRYGPPLWSGVTPDGGGARTVLLYQFSSCWQLVEWKAGDSSYCVTRSGPVLDTQGRNKP